MASVRVLVAVTVDCDLRRGNVIHRRAALEALLGLFRRAGLSGHVTWFLNENDFKIVEWHGDFVDEVLERGDSIGVHDHFDRYDTIHDYDPPARPVDILCFEEVYRLMRLSKEAVEAYLRERGWDAPVAMHRNGCLVQSRAIYRALRELGYRVVSDVAPQEHVNGSKFADRSGRPNVMFNEGVPLSVQPYRHDVDNWADYRSREGHFIQVPVHYLGRDLNFGYFEHFLRACEGEGLAECVFCWLFHPYEIQAATGEVDGAKLRSLEDLLAKLRDDYGASFVSFDELLERLEL